MAKRKSENVKYLEGLRKQANQQFSRSDAYGRGVKAGIDAAIESAKATESGMVYNPKTDTFQEVN